MKILITGAAGFIGYHLSKELLRNDYEIIGLDNLNDFYDLNLKKDRLKILSKHKNFNFVKSDINDLDLINKEPIDLIINLAAQAGVRSSEKNFVNYLSSNMNGFFHLLDFAKNKNIKNIIFASSSSVYSSVNSAPFSEEEELYSPSSFYGSTKLFNENLAKIYHQLHGINFIGLRFFTVYGNYGRPDMAYFKFASNIIEKKVIKLFNMGKTKRDMTHVSDVVQGIANAIKVLYQNDESAYFEIFNLGNDKPVSSNELLSIIEEKLAQKALVKNVVYPEENITHASMLKSKDQLNYQPQIDVNAGIEEFCLWLKNYKKL